MDEESGPKWFLEKFFPGTADAMALAAGHGKKKDYRGVIETSSATTQCNRSGHPFQANTICYICGTMMPDKSTLSPINGYLPANDLYPECEHILPLEQALRFLDIYAITKAKNSNPWYETAIQLEYAYAHRVCNQAKSTTSFVGDPALSKLVLNFDETSTKKILKDIKDRADRDIVSGLYTPDEVARLQKIADAVADVPTRIAAISPKIKLISDHIAQGRTQAEVGDLLLLARTAKNIDESQFSPSVRKVLENARTQFMNAFSQERLNELIQETYNSYPDLHPSNITRVLYGGRLLNIPGEYKVDLTDQYMYDFLSAYIQFSKDLPEDPYGERLISAVTYKVYRDILSEYESKNATINTKDLPWICYLIVAVYTLEINESLQGLKGFFGAIFETTATEKYKSLLTQCNTYFDKLNSTMLRMDRVEGDAGEVYQPVTEEDYATFFYDKYVQDRIYGSLVSLQIPAKESKEITDQVIFMGIANFISKAIEPTENPNIVDILDESARTAAETLVNKIQPNDPEKISSELYTFLMEYWQSKEIKQEGGLRKRFHFKLNARTTSSRVSRTSKHSRLRKRAGKGGTYRVRQSAGKSRTWRQRLSLGSLRPSIPSYYGGNSNVQSDVEWGSFYANN